MSNFWNFRTQGRHTILYSERLKTGKPHKGTTNCNLVPPWRKTCHITYRMGSRIKGQIQWWKKRNTLFIHRRTLVYYLVWQINGSLIHIRHQMLF